MKKPWMVLGFSFGDLEGETTDIGKAISSGDTLILVVCSHCGQGRAFQLALVIKSLHCKAGDIRDASLIPGVGKIPWRRAYQPTPIFLLENSMDRGAWWATIHGVAKSRTGLKQLSTAHTQ